MYGEFLKWHIFQLVAPIQALFVASPLGFGGIHDDINFFAMRRSYRKLLKKQRLQTQCIPNCILVLLSRFMKSNVGMFSIQYVFLS